MRTGPSKLYYFVSKNWNERQRRLRSDSGIGWTDRKKTRKGRSSGFLKRVMGVHQAV